LRNCFSHLIEALTITKSWKIIISDILLHFASAWKLSEETAHQKNISEASFYRYKPQTHVIENDNNEDENISNMFPDYEVEFNKHDDGTELMDCCDKPEESSSSLDCTISSDVMVEVCMVHLLSSSIPADHIPLLKYSQYMSSSFLGYLLAGSLTEQLTTLPGITSSVSSYQLCAFDVIPL